MIRLDDRVLLRLRVGDRSPVLAEVVDRYVGRMANYFARRALRYTSCIDADDLAQLGRIALYEGVVAYRWRCTCCRLATDSEAGLVRHFERRHPGVRVAASPTILRYIHAVVGRAMDHEVRRYSRRWKFVGEMPGEPIAVAPSQEWAAELALALRRLERNEDSTTASELRRVLEGERWAGNGRRSTG